MSDLIVLKVYRGDKLITVKQYTSPQIMIGRQVDAALSLDDESISPVHAVIENREGKYYLADLGSDLGVSLEGKQVLESELSTGQAIGIGPYSVRFYIGIPTPPITPDFQKSHVPPVREEIFEEDDVDVDEWVKSITNEAEVSDFSAEDNEVTDPAAFTENMDSEVTDPGVFSKKNVAQSSNANANEDLQDQDFSQVQEIPVETSKESNFSPSEPGVQSVTIVNEDPQDVLERQMREPLSSGSIAPSSSFSQVDEIIDPYSRGSVIEVVVCWKERILKTYHFSNSQDVYMSNQEGEGDIHVPLMGKNFKMKLLTLKNATTVHIAKTMSGKFYANQNVQDLSALSGSANVRAIGSRYDLDLNQGQMLELALMPGKLFVYVRHVEDTSKAAMAPVMDLTLSELMGVMMAAVSVAVIALYMMFYVPENINDKDRLLEDRLKKATITFNPPIRRAPPVPLEIKKVEPIKQKVVAKISEKKTVVKPKPQPKKAANSKPKSDLKKGVKPKAEDLTKKAGKPKSAAPSRVKSKSDAGSSRPGGSVKTGKKASNQASKKPDPTKTGLLGILSGGGKNTALDKAYSGAGTALGTADEKTGYQGQLSEQKGQGFGTKLQKAGKGGTGSSLAGVGDVKTSGRGGGQGSYGVSGLGGKGTSTIVNVDGGGGEFSSSIDKDAIRRLIRRNKNAIRACYERALSQNSRLSGKVVLSWKITDGGRMISPKVVNSTLSNPQVEQCLIRRLMGLTFPSPAANEIAEVESYPFIFEARN